MKYYSEGRPIQESTRTVDRVEAQEASEREEGEVATGLYRGPKIERIPVRGSRRTRQTRLPNQQNEKRPGALTST